MPTPVSDHVWPIVFYAALATACGPLHPLAHAPSSPHARYTDGLHSAGLDSSAMGQQWVAAGARALTTPIPASIPVALSAYVPVQEPLALGYRISPARGQRVVVAVEVTSSAPLKVFLEVFEQRADERTPELVLFATDSLHLSWTAERDRQYIVRVQPELLRSARIDLRITAQASLGFPVSGRSSEHVRSFFGDAREGGRRHEGLDIFAPKGTPAVAATDGWASASESKLGGKVIWLRSGDEAFTLYYAHLDQQLVDGSRHVRAGDTLGLVGNTGNAEHTPAHLHFGIYAQEGAVDPLPFVNTKVHQPPKLVADTTLLLEGARVAVKKAALRAAPDAKAIVLAQLPKNSYIQARAASGDWFHVQHNDTTCYVQATALEPVRKPLKRIALPVDADLVDAPMPQAPLVQQLEAGTLVDLLAYDGAYQHVRAGEKDGWILAP